MSLRKLALVLALSVVPIGVIGQAAPARDGARPLATEEVKIVTGHGVRKFHVEIARTEAEQALGLMFRTRIPVGTGMIFPMAPPRPVAFWMKNCPVPEDMIFIKPDGRIESIARMTRPNDETPISSGGSISAVLEVAGGTALRMGIKPGDKVVW